MKTYVEEVTSDSILKELHYGANLLRVLLTLYTGDELALRFEEVVGISSFSYLWGASVEGLAVTDESTFREVIKKGLVGDSAADAQHRSYQFLDGDDQIVLEVVAGKLMIGNTVHNS